MWKPWTMRKVQTFWNYWEWTINYKFTHQQKDKPQENNELSKYCNEEHPNHLLKIYLLEWSIEEKELASR